MKTRAQIKKEQSITLPNEEKAIPAKKSKKQLL
jgi:hypothetical protein